MTNKDVLEQYLSAIAECRALEQELLYLQEQGWEHVVDAVTGCPDEPPYSPRSIQIAGIAQNPAVTKNIEEIEKLLDAQRITTIDIRLKAEKIIFDAPSSVLRMILRYKYIKGMEWQDVADRMTEESSGKTYTEDGVRKQSERYLNKIS